ncbi:patatin-like phospholipase family protein [Azohydromonas sediminis]|uniref:patatin-like phospholipase family protein n=1 Tax=Azohydromonas sediminis TaxID=2259674 RepID=UPI000E64B5E9|nr:patatin-like phospholipase family protein [Azohydromonas sediminis]
MTTRPLDLALQGGGSHGAFTWGVLDRLLDDERIRIAAVSGTSAGAMNAVALAAGWVADGRRGARESLRRFWARVAEGMHLARWAEGWMGANPAAMLAAPPPLHAAWEMASRWFAPVAAADDGNPLRAVLADTVDFDAVRRCRDIQLFVGATHVQTGRLRVFRGPELTADAVLASACLPMLFPSVVIDGEAYWDGGYMGNPPLLPLLAESPTLDLMLVQVHPERRKALPEGPAAILDRVNEITFHGSLVKELRSLAILRRLMHDEGVAGAQCRSPLFRKADALRLHRIEGGERLDGLDAPQPFESPWQHLLALHRQGHAAADEWLRERFTHLGRHATVDLLAEYLHPDELGADGGAGGKGDVSARR